MKEDDFIMALKVIGVGILALALWIILNRYESMKEHAALDQRIQAIEKVIKP